MVAFARLSAQEALGEVEGLARLLVDAVDNGASVTFMPPLALGTATEFWRETIQGSLGEARWRIVLALDQGEVIGCAMLRPAWQTNQLHRAEVAKVLVHSRARRRGIGRELMKILEEEAREGGFRLVNLDTCRGDSAELLYRSLGYVEAGVIPRFAVKPDGTMCDTVLFYKELDQLTEA